MVEFCYPHQRCYQIYALERPVPIHKISICIGMGVLASCHIVDFDASEITHHSHQVAMTLDTALHIHDHPLAAVPHCIRCITVTRILINALYYVM